MAEAGPERSVTIPEGTEKMPHSCAVGRNEGKRWVFKLFLLGFYKEIKKLSVCLCCQV